MTDSQKANLAALCEKIIPSEPDAPGAIAAGVPTFIEELLGAERLPDRAEILALLDEPTSDESSPAFRLVAELVHEGYWSRPEGWDACGFTVSPSPRPAPQPPGLGESSPPVPPELGARGLEVSYDVIVVGAGAGGGTIAGLLAEAGRRVLLLERGGDPSFAQVGRDHLRNQRLPVYGHNAGPDSDHPREVNGQRVLPWQGNYHANAALVGGGTRVWGMQAWRFHPLDFKMASTYGVPEGSSLADWPISRAELDPFYARAEREIGVCGENHPMPPLAQTVRGTRVYGALEALGWEKVRVPLALNSQPHLGRAACVECQHCVGFACPSDAKNGSHNTLIPRGLLTGRLDLITGAMASKIELQGERARGVHYFVEDEARYAQADLVIVAVGAIESARLLMLSGVQNEHLGRHLQGHVYSGAVGRFEADLWDGRGPGVTSATTEFSHGNEGIVGGGMLADEFIPLPLYAWKNLRPPGVPRHGLESKRWLRENYRKLVQLHGPAQDIPSPNARVQLSETLKDRWALPVARLSGAVHEATIPVAQLLADRAEDWLRASGAIETWRRAPDRPYLSAGQHQAGTCRMTDDPSQGVVDPNQKVFGYDNLFVCDASVHVTNGGFNPALTVFALAFRLGEYLVGNR